MSRTKYPQNTPFKTDKISCNSIDYEHPEAPDFSLLRVEENWKPIFDWSVQQGVVDVLFLIRTGLLINKLHPREDLAYIFQFVLQRDLRTLLAHWATQNDTAHDLYRLSQAILNAPEVMNYFLAVGDERAEDTQLHGKLHVEYLLGMLMSKPKKLTEYQRIEITTLKYWILLLGLQKAKENQIQITQLRIAAENLRHATRKPEHPSRETFFSIYPDLLDLDLIGAEIHQKADARSALLKKGDNLTGTDKSLLTAMKAIGNNILTNEDYQVDEGGSCYDHIDASLGTSLQVKPLPPFTVPTDTDESITISGEEGSQDVHVVNTSPKTSYAEQKSAVSDVLLMEAGKQQFLPYHWQSLTPQEYLYLEQWIEETLASVDKAEKLLSVCVWIATYTGQSLHSVLLTDISEVPGKNWTLDPVASRLFREPPMRQNSWEPQGAATQWVRPVSDHIETPLPNQVSSVLTEAMASGLSARSLHSLLSQVMGLPSDEGDKEAFRQTAHLFRYLTRNGPLRRVQPGMLGSVYPQTLFNEAEDTAYAHLLASRNDRGLPGNCAYPSWYLPDEQLTAAHLVVNGSASNIIHIGLGSRLDPIEQRLIDSMDEAAHRLQDIQSEENLLLFHNALVSYLTIAVLAATGARPVKDLIESPRQIDFEQKFLFIEDKAADSATDGRIVPLPSALCNYLGTDYLGYLGTLSQELKNASAPEVAHEIQQLADGEPSREIPLLFYLEHEGGVLTWTSISETRLEEQELFQWPLPWNLFRHRLAKQLRYRSIHPEIIDGLFGHIEGTTASWGSYSLRSWEQDMQYARPAIEAAFDNLDFELPDLSASLPKLKRGWIKEQVSQGNYGREARKVARKEYREKVRVATELEILRYVSKEAGKEDLTELDEQQIEILSKQMMLLPNGPPRKNGWFRYEVLINLLEAAWRDTGKKVRIKRRYARPFMEKSGFTPHAPNARQSLCDLQEFTRNPYLAKRLARKSVYQNAVLGVLLLLSENRIADVSLLKDVLFKRNYRLVSYKGCAYLEHAPSLKKDDPLAAVQRYRINVATAQVLNHALKTTRPWKKEYPPPPWMAPFIENIALLPGKSTPKTFVGVLRILVSRVQQANVQLFPGVVAAYLNGHINSISLSWHDWVRMDTGRQLDLPDKLPSPQDKEEIEFVEERDLEYPKNFQPIYSNNAWLGNDPEKLQSAAYEFLQLLRIKLKAEESQSPSNNYEERDRIARELITIMQESASGVCSSIILLGRWITRVLFRQVREGGRWHYIKFSSIQRYLDEFGQQFCQLAYNVDLATADEEIVTTLYQHFLDEKSEDGKAYAFNRLMDFHDFAREEDVVDPDWSELPRVGRRFSVSPGIILEEEYLGTLHLLLKQPGLSRPFRYAQAFILLCGYRFGTRANEALGLRHKDWMDYFDPVELLIESNKVRSLKNQASRRRVPLLFKLEDVEKDILSSVLLNDELQYEHESSPYLFTASLRAEEWRVMGGINKALKTVTGNPRTVLHHARHTAANRVASALFHPDLPSWWDHLRVDDLCRERMRKDLLITPSLTRRTSWAGGFFLGHAGPKTTLHSYIHFVGDWADALLDLSPEFQGAPLDQFIVLDDYPEKAPLDTTLLSAFTPPFDRVTPARVLQLMRHRALGKECVQVSASLGIDGALCRDLDKLLLSLANKVRIKHEKKSNSEEEEQENRGKSEFTVPNDSLYYLWRISIGGWRRLVDLCDRVDEKKPLPEIAISTLELREIIGATRQILLWKKSHFAAFSEFIEYFSLISEPYLLIHSEGIPEKRILQAKRCGLEPVSARSALIKDTVSKRGIELDRIQKGGSEDYKVKKRVAAILTRTQEGSIHGSYEWIALFIAWVVAAQSQ